MSLAPQLWTPAYVGIGSNLDDPAAQAEIAIRELANASACRLIARSQLYRTTPLGPQDQPEFINAAVGLLTTLSARELLEELQRIEARMGRERKVHWGPRRIDLDLLVFGDARVDQPDLTLPHPGVPTRNFVLYPLRDIAPTLLVPGHGRVDALAARAGSSGLVIHQ